MTIERLIYCYLDLAKKYHVPYKLIQQIQLQYTGINLVINLNNLVDKYYQWKEPTFPILADNEFDDFPEIDY